jgi:anti-sigma B factor antagonist
MNYEIHKVQDVVVAELKGDVWAEHHHFQLKDEVSAILQLGNRRFLFDLSETKFMNSLGLGVIVSCWASIRREGGELKLCSVGPRVQATFEVTGLDTLFEIRPDRATALAEFGVAADG